MNYQDAVNYLKNLTKFGINLGLERITELLRRVGNPHQYLKVVHVGGTNGKGSTTAMIAAVLQQAGYLTGTFTSPHLHRYTERYRINGREISEQQIAELVAFLKPHLDSMVKEGHEHPTEFEVSTVLALLYFYRQRVDYAVLEVGLGGEIDSTNVVRPLVAVITNVSMDHMDYLGSTLTEIAQVKAGIIKPRVPLVTAAGQPEVQQVIEKAAAKHAAPLTVVGKQVTWQRLMHNADISGQYLTIKGRRSVYPNIFLPLLGEHQQINAATAVAALEWVTEQGGVISPDDIRRGLANVTWPGRFEIVPGEPTAVLDGAHNVGGAEALAAALKQYFPNKRIVMLLGMLADKERQKVINILLPLADAAVVTKPNSPRAGDWQKAAQWAKKHVDTVAVCEQIDEAVKTGLNLAGPCDVLCITGSLYMLAEAREYLLKLHKINKPYQ